MRCHAAGAFHQAIRRLAGFTVALSALLSVPARAAVGDDVATVAVDGARLHAELTVSRRGSYELHELAMPTGVRLRHFVGSGGTVFAVSWSGGWRPNLRDVMGSHYDDFIAATRGRPLKRGVARIETRGMVVVMGGPPRASFGHVYLTALLPADFFSTGRALLDGRSE